jgi:hypothetical protein
VARELKLDKAKILQQLKDLQSMSKKWTLTYSPEVDQLFYGLAKIPKGSFLYQINDEINLYVDKNSYVSGMFVEYFRNNYLEHNEELKPILDVLEGKKNQNDGIKEIERTALENELFFSAYTSVEDKEELATIA